MIHGLAAECKFQTQHLKCKTDGKGFVMVKLKRWSIRYAPFITVAAITSCVSTAAFADGLVVLREVPPRSAFHEAPPGPATTVETAPTAMVLALVPNGKRLSDEQVANVFAQVNNPNQGMSGPNMDPSTLVANANSRAGLTGSPDGGLSSVSRLGSTLSNTVNSNIGQTVGQIAPAIQNAVPGAAPGG